MRKADTGDKASLERAIEAAMAHATACGDKATALELQAILLAFFPRDSPVGREV